MSKYLILKGIKETNAHLESIQDQNAEMANIAEKAMMARKKKELEEKDERRKKEQLKIKSMISNLLKDLIINQNNSTKININDISLIQNYIKTQYSKSMEIGILDIKTKNICEKKSIKDIFLKSIKYFFLYALIGTILGLIFNSFLGFILLFPIYLYIQINFLVNGKNFDMSYLNCLKENSNIDRVNNLYNGHIQKAKKIQKELYNASSFEIFTKIFIDQNLKDAFDILSKDIEKKELYKSIEKVYMLLDIDSMNPMIEFKYDDDDLRYLNFLESNN